MGCRRRQARQGFLLSTLPLVTPWTMNGEITQNPNSGEARHATRQGSRHADETDHHKGVPRLLYDRTH